VIYKWYAWYLFGYCCNKKDYRLFKVLRIRNVRTLEKLFSIMHESLEVLLVKQEQHDNRKYIDVKLLCTEEIRISLEEYFPNASITTKENGYFILQFHVPNN